MHLGSGEIRVVLSARAAGNVDGGIRASARKGPQRAKAHAEFAEEDLHLDLVQLTPSPSVHVGTELRFEKVEPLSKRAQDEVVRRLYLRRGHRVVEQVEARLRRRWIFE